MSALGCYDLQMTAPALKTQASNLTSLPQPPRPAGMKPWKWVAVAGAVLAAGGVTWRLTHKRHDGPRYETVAVERGRLVANVTATGTLSALVTVTVGSQVSGRIAALHADFNSKVKKGELVAKIDPQLFEAQVEQQKANVTSAQGQVDQAKANATNMKLQFERDKLLLPQKLIAQGDYDTAEAAWRSSEAQIVQMQGNLEQALANLHQAKVNLDYTNIISPINGVVISRAVDVGQTVAASMTAPTLFTIAEDLQKMQVDSSVTESDVGRLKEGMRATFGVDAYPGETFVGKIRQVRNAATTTQNVVTYDAVIDVDNPELKLKPGMTANVTVPWAEREDALKFANAALRFRPPPSADDAPTLKPKVLAKGGRDVDTTRTVYVYRDRVLTPLKIKVGITDGTFTELLEGDLKEGDRVVTDLAEEGKRPASGGQGPSQGGGAGGARPPRMPF